MTSYFSLAVFKVLSLSVDGLIIMSQYECFEFIQLGVC